MDYRLQIQSAREKALCWLESMKFTDEQERELFYNSSYNKKKKFEPMFFAAAYNGYHCKYLLDGEMGDNSLKGYFNRHQLPGGMFRLKGMELKDLYYPDFEYDDFHITNYTLGIMESFRMEPEYHLAFLKKYDSIRKLDRWLGRRDLTNPWTEGNNVVNLASFYIYQWQRSSAVNKRRYRRLLQRLVDWHFYMQDSETGYWMEKGQTDLISAMAGASHNFHIFFYLGLRLPYHEKIVDHCLGILDGVNSACLDIDVVDVLANLYDYGYRREEIREYLGNKLAALLNSQNADGGFCDVMTGIRNFDGWAVYQEPQGISNAFATWFRMASIGMISSTLYPETRNQWHFRKGIGMGYFKGDDRHDKPEIAEKKKIRPAKHWIGKQKKTVIDLTPPKDGEDVPALAKKVEEIFNSKDLSIFEKDVIYGFKVLEHNGTFYIKVSDHQAEQIEETGAPDIMITIAIKNLRKIIDGKLMPVMAYGLKKLAVEGDITLALKLQTLF